MNGVQRAEPEISFARLGRELSKAALRIREGTPLEAPEGMRRVAALDLADRRNYFGRLHISTRAGLRSA